MAPSFFKILEDPHAPFFTLPPEFVSMYMENKIPKEPVTLSATGGRSWILKMKQIGESYCFTNGWRQVVKDIPLGYWEYLIFHLVDESAFNITIYCRNGCELLLPPKIEPEDEDLKFENVIIIEDDETDEEKESDAAVVNGEFENVNIIEDDKTEGEKECNEVVNGEFENVACEEEDKSENVIIIKDDENEENTNVKRKRGRTRKQPLPASEIPATEVVKRKRGRPRKPPQPPSEISAMEVVKRNRGWPRKQPPPTSEIQVAVAEVKWEGDGREGSNNHQRKNHPVREVVKQKRGAAGS